MVNVCVSDTSAPSTSVQTISVVSDACGCPVSGLVCVKLTKGQSQLVSVTRSERIAVAEQEILVFLARLGNETRKQDARRCCSPRIVDVASGEAMLLRAVVIESNEPFGAVVGSRQREWRCRESDRPAIQPRLGIRTERYVKGSARAA